MIEDLNSTAPSGEAQKITPVAFRAGGRGGRKSLGRAVKWVVGIVLCLVLAGLAAAAGFVFTAVKVTIDIDPVPERVAVVGGLAAPRVGGQYLLQPGNYTLAAVKPCFADLEKPFTVSEEKKQAFNFAMVALNGKVILRIHEDDNPDGHIDKARVFIDDRAVEKSPVDGLEVQAGKRRVSVRADGYRDYQGELMVEGCGKTQNVAVAMTLGGAYVTISSVPAGAAIHVDGQLNGETPERISLPEGPHEIVLSADGYKPWRSNLTVTSGEHREFKDIALAPADGRLVVETTPAGARIMIGDQYVGESPAEVAVSPGVAHTVQMAKAGYEKATRSIRLDTAEIKTLSVDLSPVEGIVHFSVLPEGAELLINGISRGKVPSELRLIAVAHRIEIRKKEYVSFETRVTPRPGFPQELKVLLQPVGAAKPAVAPKAAQPGMLTAPNGYALIKVQPRPFTMGSSRREQGRRSNETIRQIHLSRPFYMGLREVTNSEFRAFSAQHDSGNIKSHSLNRDEFPVVQVTWEQAALFCNWLSQKASLPPAYVNAGSRIDAVEPLTVGFRLPTEAEWEYCARYDGSRVILKYPWGDRFPPIKDAGNFADASAKDLLPNIIAGYNDGYPATALTGKFKAGAFGLADMGGNVAEWSHDYYAIYGAGADASDPVGPKTGTFHVIRGSSYKDASIGSLRLTYRDYGNTKRDDLGFRVCRYAE